MRFLLLALLLFFISCNTDAPKNGEIRQEPRWEPPAAGTIVAADSMRVTDDPLNDFWFSAKIIADSAAAGKAAYRIVATFGQASAEGALPMPSGGERLLKPLLRRDSGYAFVVGFRPGAALGGDTAFHDYYRISGSRGEIKMTPLKSFRIE